MFDFDIDNFPDPQISISSNLGCYVMHCPEEWMAEEFLSYLNAHGRKWCTGVPYSSKATHWGVYGNNTCYMFNRGKYGSLGNFIDTGAIILDYEDYTSRSLDEYENDDVMVEFLKELR